jgi:hypothetical protein
MIKKNLKNNILIIINILLLLFYKMKEPTDLLAVTTLDFSNKGLTELPKEISTHFEMWKKHPFRV